MALTTETRPRYVRRDQEDPARRAWLVLINCFLVFCLLLVSSCFLFQQFRTAAVATPASPAVLTLISNSGVMIQQRGMAQQVVVKDTRTTLAEGDTIVVDAILPPGPAAMLELFDGTRIQLWPGSVLRLDQLQASLYNNSLQSITLGLLDGLALLELPRLQPYAHAEYRVSLEREGETAQATLDAGGRYLLRLLSPGHPATPRALWDVAPSMELAVLEGGAALTSAQRNVTLESEQLVRISEEGMGEPVEARWNLVRDGDFAQFTELEYNCTAVACDSTVVSSTTWLVRGDPPGTPVGGYFFVVPECVPAMSNGTCRQQVKAAEFIRRGSQGTPFRTSILQDVSADLSPYRSVMLEADVRILHQSLGLAGQQGTECPLTINLTYGNTSGGISTYDYCMFAREDSDPGEPLGVLPSDELSWISPLKLPYGEWQRISLPLKQEVPNIRNLKELHIYANGHDYTVEIANISLNAR